MYLQHLYLADRLKDELTPRRLTVPQIHQALHCLLQLAQTACGARYCSKDARPLKNVHLVQHHRLLPFPSL